MSGSWSAASATDRDRRYRDRDDRCPDRHHGRPTRWSRAHLCGIRTPIKNGTCLGDRPASRSTTVPTSPACSSPTTTVASATTRPHDTTHAAVWAMATTARSSLASASSMALAPRSPPRHRGRRRDPSAGSCWPTPDRRRPTGHGGALRFRPPVVTPGQPFSVSDIAGEVIQVQCFDQQRHDAGEAERRGVRGRPNGATWFVPEPRHSRLLHGPRHPLDQAAATRDPLAPCAPPGYGSNGPMTERRSPPTDRCWW